MLRASLAYAAAFAAVSVAVVLGAFDAVDQWAVDHVMPWLSVDVHPVTVVSALRPVQPWDPTPQVAVDAWLYPASVPISAFVLGVVAVLLWRRGRRAEAVAWCAAWLVGDALEVLFKSVLERPALHGLGHHLVGFDDSFPSGHTLRSVLLVAAVGSVFPRLRPALVLWLASTFVLLVVASWHTPSDVLGGILLAAALASAVLAFSRPRARA